MMGTFKDEVEMVDFDAPVSGCNQIYHDFSAYKRLGNQYWRAKNGVEGTLFRLPLRLEPSEISSVTYDTDRIDELLQRFKEEAHSTLIFLKHVQSIKIFVIEEGCEMLEEIYSATLSSETSQKYTGLKANFINEVQQLVSAKNFQTLKELNHFLEIRVIDEEEEVNRTHSYVVCEQYGYSGNDSQFLALMCDEELSYVPFVAVAYPINTDENADVTDDNDPGGHIFCTLPLPLHNKCMTGMPGMSSSNSCYFFDILNFFTKFLKLNSYCTKKTIAKSFKLMSHNVNYYYCAK